MVPGGQPSRSMEYGHPKLSSESISTSTTLLSQLYPQWMMYQPAEFAPCNGMLTSPCHGSKLTQSFVTYCSLCCRDVIFSSSSYVSIVWAVNVIK